MLVDVRTSYGDINRLRSYDAAIKAYGAIYYLRSYDAALLTELLTGLRGHIE
ncbi:hypothetical protein HAX54_045929, partial [Datura stramonium]|nr:hypothetical protein [Datura stramonium]